MTPYVILHPGVEAWLAYFDRTLPLVGVGDRARAYEHLMKWGHPPHGERYWLEYIFEAYATHSDSIVFLRGLPDIDESRPHSAASDTRLGG